MRRTKDRFSRRLWTCEAATRDILQEAVDGDLDVLKDSLLLHARVADSVSEVKAVAGEDVSRTRRFRITTESTDRHGDVVRSRGIKLQNFRKNPVVLFAHQASQPPIGTASKIERGDGFIDANAEFFNADTFPFADTIFRIVKAGGLKATSIGFIPLDFERLQTEDGKDTKRGLPGIDFKKSELLEFSVVPIPANPEAVARVYKDGADVAPLREFLDDMQDNWGEVQQLFEELATTEDDLQFLRKSITGERTQTQVPATPPEPIEAELPKGLIVTKDNLGAVTIDGDAPAKIQISRALIDESEKYADTPMSLDDPEDPNLVTLTFDDRVLKYAINDESEDENVVQAELVEETVRGVISFRAAHANGTPAQPKGAAWDAGAQVRSATVSDLLVMSAWRENKSPSDLTKGDFKFPHHAAAGAHAVNFRALAAGIAVLNGGRGGSAIPAADRRGVYNHLAKHVRDDFDSEPPQLRWVEIEPLKNFPDLFAFDYTEGNLLAWHREGDGIPMLVDAKYVDAPQDVSGDDTDVKSYLIKLLEDADPKEVKQGSFQIQSIAGKKDKWSGKEAFLKWAKDHGFRTDKVDETVKYWRLRQKEPSEFEKLRVICINPGDVAPTSSSCKVQATGGPVRQVGLMDERMFLLAMAVETRLASISDEAHPLWDGALTHVRAADTYFQIRDGLFHEVDEALKSEFGPVGEEDVSFARVICSRITEVTRAKELTGADQAAAEADISNYVEACGDDGELVILAKSVGKYEDEKVYRNVAAWRWFGERVSRTWLGSDGLTDPVRQLTSLVETIGLTKGLVTVENADTIFEAATQLLNIVTEFGFDSQEPDEEDEAMMGILSELAGGQDLELSEDLSFATPRRLSAPQEAAADQDVLETMEDDDLRGIVEQAVSAAFNSGEEGFGKQAIAGAVTDAIRKATGAVD